MKQCNLTKGLVVFLTIMITLFCGLMPSAWADGTPPSCDCCESQKFDEEGCYGFSHDGMMMMMVDGKLSKLSTPMASVGVLHLGGLYLDETNNIWIGDITGNEMVQFGTDAFPAMLSGTYTVNPDCTGTAFICATPTIPDGNNMGIRSEISFVIIGDEIQMVTTKMTHCISNVDTMVGAAIPLNIVGIAKKQCIP